MDLKQFEGLAKGFDDGIEVEILHPVTQKPLGMKVRVASYQSERVKAKVRQIENQRRQDAKRNPRKIVSVEKDEQTSHDVFVAAVISWEGFEVGGKPLECTPANVRMIADNPDLWFIVKQVDQAADDELAFIKA